MKVDTAAVLELIESALAADYTRLRRAGNRIARAVLNENPEAAKAIQRALRQRGVPLQASGYAEELPRDSGTRLPLIEEGSWPSSPVFLNDDSGQVIARFLEDARHIAELSHRGVSTRLGLLLHGAPGTGKSHLAGHIASQLHLPLYVVRLDSIISSRLGDTAKNIRNIFDFIPAREAVLFLDEIDAVAKVRDDKNELGELKRVVNTVLQGLDSLQDDILVIGATNHAHLLDPAIWRRFPYKLELDSPDQDVRAAMWLHFLYADREEQSFEASVLASLSAGLTGADIQNISLAARRRAIIDREEVQIAQVLVAAASSKAGAPNLVEKSMLSHEDRRKLALLLHERSKLEVTNIARVIGVSRQMAHRYLKEASNGE